MILEVRCGLKLVFMNWGYNFITSGYSWPEKIYLKRLQRNNFFFKNSNIIISEDLFKISKWILYFIVLHVIIIRETKNKQNITICILLFTIFFISPNKV